MSKLRLYSSSVRAWPVAPQDEASGEAAEDADLDQAGDSEPAAEAPQHADPAAARARRPRKARRDRDRRRRGNRCSPAFLSSLACICTVTDLHLYIVMPLSLCKMRNIHHGDLHIIST